jgi:hypothetical protein
VTLAFAGVAVGLSVRALQLQDQWSKLYGGDEAQRRSLMHDAQLDAAISDGFYGLTALGAGVTAYFTYRALRTERPAATASRVALMPVVTPTGAALVAEGRF